LEHVEINTRENNQAIRDDQGRSLRKQSFEWFEEGDDWQQTAKKPATIRRYYHQWSRLPENFDLRYAAMKKYIRDPIRRIRFMEETASILHISTSAVDQVLKRPWGLRSIMLGRQGLLKIALNETEKQNTRSEREWAAFLKFRELQVKSHMTMEELIHKINIVAMFFEKSHDAEDGTQLL
jgi:hypothetical protein